MISHENFQLSVLIRNVSKEKSHLNSSTVGNSVLLLYIIKITNPFCLFYEAVVSTVSLASIILYAHPEQQWDYVCLILFLSRE